MRLLAVGMWNWTDHRITMSALKRAMEVYRGPWTLVCNGSDGAARHAAAAARKLGWQVDVFELDTTKCGPECPADDHRRPGGPAGDFCPTARRRNLAAMLDSGIDQAVVFVRRTARETGERQGQAEIRARDIGIWTYTQKGRRSGNEAE